MTQELKKGFYNNLEGWNGEEDRREVQEVGDMCIPMTDSCWCLTENNKFCKAIFLICFPKWAYYKVGINNAICPVRKQRTLQPSSHHIAASPTGSSEGTQHGNRMPDIQQSTVTAAPSGAGDETPPVVRGMKRGMKKPRILALDSWGAHQRNTSVSPDSCIFPYIEKH